MDYDLTHRHGNEKIKTFYETILFDGTVKKKGRISKKPILPVEEDRKIKRSPVVVNFNT